MKKSLIPWAQALNKVIEDGDKVVDTWSASCEGDEPDGFTVEKVTRVTHYVKMAVVNDYRVDTPQDIKDKLIADFEEDAKEMIMRHIYGTVIEEINMVLGEEMPNKVRMKLEQLKVTCRTP